MWSLTPTGDPSRPRLPKRAARRRPHPRGEHHRPAARHAPGGRASPAGQQAGDPHAGAEGPLPAWDAGETPESTHVHRARNAHNGYSDSVCVCASLQEIVINKQPGEKLGISIRGGAKGHAGNPFDPTDEGIFISKVLEVSFLPAWYWISILPF